MNLKPLSLAFRILCYTVFLHFIHIHFIRPCYCVFMYVCICVHLTDFLKTRLTKLAVNCMSERASKGRFLTVTKEKERRKRKSEEKERRRREKNIVTVFDAILTNRQTPEKLQWLYENLMSNNFRKTAVLKKIWFVN